MRIWQLLDCYYPDYGGGVGLAVRSICRLLAERGHEVRVLCTEATGADPYSVRTDWDGPVRVERVNLPYFRDHHDPEGWQLGLGKWLTHQRRVDRLLRELLATWRPDVAHYHVVRPLGEQCLETLDRQGIPVVTTLHDAWLICTRLYLQRSPDRAHCPGPSPLGCFACRYSEYGDGRAGALLRLPLRMLRRGAGPALRMTRRAKARRVLKGVSSGARWLTAVHQRHLPVEVTQVPLGIDLTGCPATPRIRPPGPVRFGFVGGWVSHKGIQQVLEASAMLAHQGTQFELHVWGPGPALTIPSELESTVRVRGAYVQEDRWRVFSEMDALVMATRNVEPFGLVIQEARAVGVPSIAPNAGGPAEQIRDGVDGLLYPSGDSQSLASQMERVLTNPSLLESLSQSQGAPLDMQDTVTDLEAMYARFVDAAG